MAKYTNPFLREGLQAQGFTGFLTFGELWSGGITQVPDGGGVYVVLRENDDAPLFLDANPGGRFKGKDPPVSPDTLRDRWMAGAHVIYIGKGDTLRRRLRQFMAFGSGKPVGHWGGRYVWQCEGSENFVVAWREVEPPQTPREAELELLARFKASHGGRQPLANISG
jgi:hypothetical protein